MRRRTPSLCAALVVLWTLQAQALTLRLTWDPPSSGVPQGYVMYRQLGGSGPFEVLATIPAPTTSYTDSTAPLGVSCYYATAFNATGESVPSNTACFQSLEVPGPPLALRLMP